MDELCKSEVTVDTGSLEIVHACEEQDGDGHLEHACSCGETWHEEAPC